MSSTAPAVNMNMAGMNMTGMNMGSMNMNMSMPSIGAACGMTTEPKQCGVQFPLHAQRRKRRVLFTQAQVIARFIACVSLEKKALEILQGKLRKRNRHTFSVKEFVNIFKRDS